MHSPVAQWTRAASSAVLLCLASGLSAQPRMQSEAGFTLRVSVVSSLDLAESTAREHGIERSPVRGVLNVTLMKGDGAAGPSVPAEVLARIKDLYGASHSVQMHQVQAEGRTSYYGSFRHEPREVLDFDVSARPREGGPRIDLRFRERMGPPETR